MLALGSASLCGWPIVAVLGVWPFVGVDPAGVQVAKEESLVIWFALMLVSFPHD